MCGLKYLGRLPALELNFLQDEVNCVFWFVTSSGQPSNALRDAGGSCRCSTRRMFGTFVVAEFCQGKAIIGAHGLPFAQQGGDGVIPVAFRATPASEIRNRDPDCRSLHESASASGPHENSLLLLGAPSDYAALGSMSEMRFNANSQSRIRTLNPNGVSRMGTCPRPG